MEGTPGLGLHSHRLCISQNPRTLGLGVMERPPSPSSGTSSYWLKKHSDPETSLRGRHTPPCAIHDWGLCSNPVAARRLWSSSSGQARGQGGAEEEEDNEEDPIEIFPALVLLSPHQFIIQICVSEQGRPTRTLAPRSGPRGLEGGPHVMGSITSPLLLEDNDRSAIVMPSPTLHSPIGGCILHSFTHLTNPSYLDQRPGAWNPPTRP
jgi:hypothetical protein